MAKRLSPQEMMAQRNPLMRTPVAPVDIYSQPRPVTPVAEPEASKKSEPKQTQRKPVKTEKKTEVEPKVTKKPVEQAEGSDSPYSTYLYKSQVKGIKLRAIEQDVKDKHIVQQAIDEYFKNHPL
jgi:hypothetical protein